MKKLFLSLVTLLMAGSVMAKSASDAETIPVHLVHIGWNNSVEDTGLWELSAYSADSSYWVFLANYTKVNQVAGTYTTFDMDEFSSFLYDLERTGTQQQMYTDLTVKIDSINDKFVISALYTTMAGLVYDITVDSIPANNMQEITNLNRVPFSPESKRQAETYTLSGQRIVPGMKGLQIKKGKTLFAK